MSSSLGPRSGHRGRRRPAVGEADPVHDDRFRLGLLRAGAGLVRERVPGEDQPGPGVAQVIGDLPGLEQRVHRDDHAAGPEHAVVHHGDFGDVGHHDADPVAGLEAALVQQPGDPGARLVQGPVRHRRVVHPHGHPSGLGTGGVRQVTGQVRHAAHCPAGSPGGRRSPVSSLSPGVGTAAQPLCRWPEEGAHPRVASTLSPGRRSLASWITPRKGPGWTHPPPMAGTPLLLSTPPG